MAKQLENDETIAAYDELSSHYEGYSLKRKSYLDAVDKLVIERLSTEDILLDIGSGDGRRLEKISKAAGLTNPVAVEPSPEMAKLCRARGIEVLNVTADGIDTLLDDSNYSCITALWNVFGHIAGVEEREKVFAILKRKLARGGKVIFDVNNRHNAPAYGYWNVVKRRIIDWLCFDERRGDAEYDWNISGKTFASKGHLFTPTEIRSLVDRSGLKIDEFLSVNYKSGEVSKKLTEGQLFLVVSKSSA